MDCDRGTGVNRRLKIEVNHVRPHRSLGYITPNEFAQKLKLWLSLDNSINGLLVQDDRSG